MMGKPKNCTKICMVCIGLSNFWHQTKIVLLKFFIIHLIHWNWNSGGIIINVNMAIFMHNILCTNFLVCDHNKKSSTSNDNITPGYDFNIKTLKWFTTSLHIIDN